MDINQIITAVKEKFGDKVDVAKITTLLQGLDLSKISLPEIMEKVKESGLVGASNLQGAVEGLKDKAGDLLGGLMGKLHK